MTCPFYDELDKVLCHCPSFCPIESDVLSSANSNIPSCMETTANVTSESVDIITLREPFDFYCKSHNEI